MKTPDYSPDRWLEFLRLSDGQLLKKAKRDTYKSKGKGGQKKNKTENAARLSLGKLMVTETAQRSKEANLSGALRKLRIAIALDFLKGSELRELQPNAPREIAPYLDQAELRINAKNPAYPLFLAWYLDRYLAHRGDWAAVAEDLGTSKSQAVKFAERNKPLLGALSQAEEYLMVIRLLENSSSPAP